jgi:pyrroloquinoline quinone biosynthesis protein D
VITAESRPTLAAKARLRWDRQASRYMLLYPERGLVLNETAADVVQLCTGEHTVGAIVQELTQKYVSEPTENVEREVLTLLERLASRGLIKSADD